MAKGKRKKKKQEVAVVPQNTLYGTAIDFATAQFRLGVSEKKIVDDLMESNPKFTPENIQFIIHRSSLEVADEHVRDRGSIIGIHVRRYNEELKRELANKHEDIQLLHIRKQFRMQSLLVCLEIMFAKERVLQIHAKDTQIKIFNKLNAKIKERKIAYDLSTLTLAEKVDFLSLVMKAKRTVAEVFSVRTKESIETIDIAHEEVVVENNNVKLITNTNDNVQEVKVLPERSINDVMEKMRKALERQALKELTQKGAKQIAPNPIDLRHDDYHQQMLKLQEQQTHSQ